MLRRLSEAFNSFKGVIISSITCTLKFMSESKIFKVIEATTFIGIIIYMLVLLVIINCAFMSMIISEQNWLFKISELVFILFLDVISVVNLVRKT
jgi:hypothetical protein